MRKEFRIPLVGSHNNRVTINNAVNEFGPSSGYVGGGIVGVMIVAKTLGGGHKDQRYINCFSESITDPMSGTKRIYCVKRPGWETANTPEAGSIATAILIWTGGSGGTKVITAFGGTNSTIYDGISSLGAITGKATGITETFVSTTATLLVPSTDSTAWYYDVGAGMMTKITDSDFPGNASKTLAGNFAHLDGFACIMDTTGAVWASDVNSVTGWTANNFESTNEYPDRGIGCVRHKNLILAFGTESVQFFYNAGLTPFPLARIQHMTIKVGAVSADAIAQIADTIFWCGSTPQGGVSIFQYNGAIERISKPEIDSVLLLAGASNISLTTVRFFGRSFVIVIASTNTLVYCIEEKTWHEWNSAVMPWYKCAGISIGGALVNYSISNTKTDGKVYKMNPVAFVYTDDTVVYTARAQLALMDFGTKRRKFWQEAELVADIEPSTSPIALAYTDDDYVTETVHSMLDLATDRPRATRLGSSRRRGWIISHSAPTPMRLEALEGVAEIGAS